MQQIHSNLHHCSTCALTITCLQEPQLALLYGELHILHIAIVLLQFVLQSIQFLVELGHCLLHRRILGCTLLLRDACTLCPALRTNLCNLLRCADTGYNVLTLSVDQILTVEEVLTVTSVTAEANTCCGCLAHVAEHHSHY